MSGRTIRPRNLDVTKKLQIRRVQDVTFKEGDKTLSVSTAKQGTVTKVVESKKLFIPTPQTQKVKPGVDVQRQFKQPANYIHFTNCTGAKVITKHDRYDLLEDDVEWMHDFNQKNQKERYPLNEESMEALIDLFEKQSWFTAKTKSVDPSGMYPVSIARIDAEEKLNIRPRISEKVYDYWRGKRLKLDKALMRKFQQPPPHEDNNPHVAFRQRVPEAGRRISYRNPKKNDPSAYYKMKVLRKDFDRLLEIIDHVKERETLKRDWHLIESEIYDKKLDSVLPAKIKDDPEVKPYMRARVPKCPEKRQKETTRRKRKEPSRKQKMRASREKAPQPPVVEVSDDDVFSKTDDSDREFYENIENMLAETNMADKGLSPRKLLSDSGFPAPHWLPDWKDTLSEEIPSFEEVKKKEDENENSNAMIEAPAVQNREGTTPAHQSFLKHRGRFCGRIGRGGRLFIMLKKRGRGRGRNPGLDGLDEDDDDELLLEELNGDW